MMHRSAKLLPRAGCWTRRPSTRSQGSRCAVVESMRAENNIPAGDVPSTGAGQERAYVSLIGSGKVETVKKRWQHAQTKTHGTTTHF